MKQCICRVLVDSITVSYYDVVRDTAHKLIPIELDHVSILENSSVVRPGPAHQLQGQ